MTIKSNKKDFLITSGLWKGYSLYDLYTWAQTPFEWMRELFNYAREIDITIFSTPFDETAVDLLEDLNTPAYKVASFEATDLPLLKYIGSTKKPVIVSTGLANLEEIKEAAKNIKYDCVVAEAFYRVFWLEFMHTGKRWVEFRRSRLVILSEDFAIRRAISERFIPCFDRMRSRVSEDKVRFSKVMRKNNAAKVIF